MKKPTAFQFFTIYGLLIVFAWIVAGWYLSQRGYGALEILWAMIGINMIFVVINLIGTVFAMEGHVPWREDDP